MTARSPTQTHPARPTAPTDRRRRRRAPLPLLCLVVIVCALLAGPSPATAEQRCTRLAQSDCQPRDEPLDLRHELIALVASLTRATAPADDATPRFAELEADQAVLDEQGLLLIGAVTLLLGDLTVHASRARLGSDATFELDEVSVSLDTGTLTAARITQAPGTATVVAEDLHLDTPDGRTLRIDRLSIQVPDAKLRSEAQNVPPQGGRDGEAVAGGPERLDERREAGGEAPHIVAEGIEVALCGCPDGDGLLAPGARIERLELTLDETALAADAALELGAVELHLAGLELPLVTGPVHLDGRATGLMPPRLGGGSETGFEAELPVFVRLGRHADLTLGAGWATAIGPLLSLRERHHVDAFTRGELAARARYDLDGEVLDVTARGAASVTVLERLRALVHLDLLTRPALHVERFEALWDRARRGARSAVALGWDGELLALSASAEVFQTRPRQRAIVLEDQRDEPFPAALPAVHRLPAVVLGLLAWPLEPVRFDLDARYSHATSFAGPGFVDFGGDDPLLGVLGPLPEPLLGDGLRAPAEPLARVDHVLLRAGLTWPVQLAGYGTLQSALGLTQRFDVASRPDDERSALARSTSLDAAVELSTSLVKHDDAVGHVLRPRVAWRSRLVHSEDDAIGAPTVAGLVQWHGFEHAVEAGVGARWFARDWTLDTELLAVVMPVTDEALGCPGGVCGLASLSGRLVWADLVELRALTDVPVDRPQNPTALAALELTPDPVRIWLSHLHESGVVWRHGRPTGLLPFEPWLGPRRTLLIDATRVESDVSEVGVGFDVAGLVAAAGVALVYRPDLALETRAALGYTGECGCWNVGVALERHAVAPTWDVLATLRLTPGFDALDAAFYAPRVRPGGAL